MKVLWKRSFHVDWSEICRSQIIATLCARNPAQCSSWRGSLSSTSTPNPTFFANEFHQSLLFSNRLFKRTQPSFIYIFLPRLLACLLPSNSISSIVFLFQASFRHFSWCQYAPIMLRSMKMHSRKTENIKQMLAVVFLDTNVVFFLSPTMADVDEWKLKTPKHFQSKCFTFFRRWHNALICANLTPRSEN